MWDFNVIQVLRIEKYSVKPGHLDTRTKRLTDESPSSLYVPWRRLPLLKFIPFYFLCWYVEDHIVHLM